MAEVGQQIKKADHFKILSTRGMLAPLDAKVLSCDNGIKILAVPGMGVVVYDENTDSVIGRLANNYIILFNVIIF